MHGMSSLAVAQFQARSVKFQEKQTIEIKSVDKDLANERLNQIIVLKQRIGELEGQLSTMAREIFTLRESAVMFLSIRDIEKEICSYFKLTRIDLISPMRLKSFILPRHVAFYLCRTHTLKSFTEIGLWFGGRDHSSILHGYRKICVLRHENPVVNGHLVKIEEILQAKLLELQEKRILQSLSLVQGAVDAIPLVSAAPA